MDFCLFFFPWKEEQFYQGVLGLELNPERPDDRLPYNGAWLWTGNGANMIHLMEVNVMDKQTANY